MVSSDPVSEWVDRRNSVAVGTWVLGYLGTWTLGYLIEPLSTETTNA